jgi:hypothetical protein
MGSGHDASANPWPNRPNLVQRVRQRHVTRTEHIQLAQNRQRIVDLMTTLDADHLYAAVESFASRALKGPHLAYAFIAEPIDPEVEAARMTGRAQFIEAFEDVLRSGIKRGVFPAQLPDVSAACIVGAFTEALIRPVAPMARPADEEKLVSAIADLCMHAAGLATSKTTVKRRSPKRAS